MLDLLKMGIREVLPMREVVAEEGGEEEVSVWEDEEDGEVGGGGKEGEEVEEKGYMDEV